MIKELEKVGERIRAVIYRKDLNLKNYLEFLLGYRSSDFLGWEFIKGGVKEDETLEDAVYREIREEAGIQRKYVIGQPELVDVPDAISRGERIEIIKSFKVELENPSPKIIPSPEHYKFEWFNLEDTLDNLIRRPSNRLRDMFVFPYILLKAFSEQYEQAKKLGYL